MADKRCGCTGIRCCLLCENLPKEIAAARPSIQEEIWTYCAICRKAWSEFDPEQGMDHCRSHNGKYIEFNGITIIGDFVSLSEECCIITEIDKMPWKSSQSGRRKQDFGPKVNFKKQKLKTGTFSGLPPISESIVPRMNAVDPLKSFHPVEQCHLEYVPERGSAIDPHFDDRWLWGERLVTLNLLSDSFLHFHYTQENDETIRPKVRVLMPRRSLIVVSGDARYRWMHSIPRNAITSRRVAITYRELSEEFREGGKRYELGDMVLGIARTYQGHVVE